jgi:transposase-like protein
MGKARVKPEVNGRAEPAPAGDLAPKQELAALSLATGSTWGEAARAAGAGETTLWTWAKEVPAFKARIAELRAEIVSGALGRLIDNMTSAADTLGYLTRKAKNEQVRLGAARALIELSLRVREATELEDRIRALEERR